MRVHTHRIRGNRRRGATTVEFAMTVPILFLFFLAQVEFSRANMVRHALKTGCYEGCRAGIALGTTEEDVEAAARETLNAAGLSHYQIELSPSTITPATREVTVRITAPIEGNTWVSPLFLNGVVLESSMSMERELIDQTSF